MLAPISVIPIGRLMVTVVNVAALIGSGAATGNSASHCEAERQRVLLAVLVQGLIPF